MSNASWRNSISECEISRRDFDLLSQKLFPNRVKNPNTVLIVPIHTLLYPVFIAYVPKIQNMKDL